jgi:Rrf2 family protein
MMFSTKAEYGVRVMVELARRAGAEGAGEDPISLAEIAQHDGMPLAYLEHLVARLRKAGLVDSRRGSRGGYLLARSPTDPVQTDCRPIDRPIQPRRPEPEPAIWPT